MATPFVISGRDMENILSQINNKFDAINARLDKLEAASVELHKFEPEQAEEEKPKRGRPAKDAA